MIRLLVFIGCAIVFAVLGLITGLVIVLNLPKDIHDPGGAVRIGVVIGPAVGGAVFGVIVGLIAAAMAPRTKSQTESLPKN